MSSEMNEVRDHLDIKDRKISVLQRKVNICEGQSDSVLQRKVNICEGQSAIVSFRERYVKDRVIVSFGER
jgi:hypothetical protein